MTEATLDESVVTLTLKGAKYERSTLDIRRAVTVSGIAGVTIPRHEPDRKSDTKLTIELEFNGDFDSDAILTFTVGADAIANYNGPGFTVQVPVSGGEESVVATTAAPLTEATLDESVVTLTLRGAKYERSTFDIRRAVTVSGIAGVTIPRHEPDRKNDTELTVELAFDGTDFDTASILIFTVGADAIANYNGPWVHSPSACHRDQGERTVGKLPKSIQSRDMDTLSVSKTGRGYHHNLRSGWTGGADLGTRIPNCRSVSEPFSCGILGWQKCIW